METLTTPADDESNQRAKTSFPDEIIEELLSRLPVKSILRFSSVSKPWLSLISAPSFPTLHSTRSHRTALFLSSYDASARKRYFLTAAHDGGPLTHIMTLDNLPLSSRKCSESEHLNGLVCFTFANGFTRSSYALLVNPTTRKSFKLPDLTPLTGYSRDVVWKTSYVFGFDESRNQHKVLNIRMGACRRRIFAPTGDVEVFIFSMSDYTWRKVNAEFPRDGLKCNIIGCSVCVGSVIHFMFRNTFDVLTFDLRTDKFSRLDVPDDPAIREFMYPRIIKVNGCVALVGCDVFRNEARIWMLQDYESRVWVRETVTFPEALDVLDGPFLLDSVSTGEIVFASRSVSRDVVTVYVYNMKTRCFKQVEFTLTHPFLCLDTMEFDQIKCYVESLVSLKGDGATT